ncbi:MAG TPA: serine hydrolase domain-containing protein [Luteibacter sp.]|jgi:CubicO group peptidase (beta-lactamase class C family)|nr:serine hydrolase domain-containing protein [Luteibacter sp.]
MSLFARLTAVLLAAITMPSAMATAGSVDTTVMDSTFQQLGSKLVRAGRADGLSIAVVKDGRVRFYNFGTVNRDAPRVPTEHTVYEIGSITKVFTSLLLAHAVAEGKVDLQEDIRHYLPGSYPELTFEGSPVRVVNLTNTTSALPDNLPDFAKIVGEAGPDKAPFLIADALRPYTRAQMFDDLASAKLSSRPGSTPKHSNLASALAGTILTKIYGDTYERLLARYVEQPFGMASGTGPARTALRASGYDEKHAAMPAFDAPSLLAAGGLRYSSADMAKFLVAELAAKDAVIQLTQQPTWGDPDSLAIGFNWIVSRTIDGKRHLRASGGTFGSSSYIEMYPELGYGIVLLANRSGRAQDDLQQLADQALQDLRGKPPAQSALENALAKDDYRDVGTVVGEVEHAHPELHLTENYINQWAYGLLTTPHPTWAIALFRYSTEQWPQSWNAFDSLGEGYERVGDKPLAIANYRHSLELNPANDHAKAALKKLSANQ